MRTRSIFRQQLFNGWPTNVQDSHVGHGRAKLNLIRRLRFEPLEDRRLLALMAGEIGSTGVTAVAGEALLSFSPGLSQLEITSFYAEHGFSELSDVTWSTESEASLLKLVSVPPYMTNDNIVALDVDPRVEYAEPNYIVTVDALPDDSLFDQLWGLNNTGQTGGTADADIDAPEAWDIATGSSQIVVGVIDTGIDYSHPDLYLNMWLNQGEIPTDLAAVLTDTNNDGLITFVDLNESANASYVDDFNGNGFVDAADLLVDQDWADGADTDGNGFPDDFVGWDFVNNDNAPWDDYGHGTHVAGTIGAMSDNGLGVAGVNWNVQIMPVKFLSASGSGSTEGAVQSVNYSTMMGVNLTNNSWGGGGFSTALYDAIEAAGDANMLFIAAAGNDGLDTDVWAHYPSSYDSDNIISVAATDHNDGRAYFSNYGATTVDLAAPGVSILSTVPGSQYASYDGTSMATPHVAGVAALAWSVNPNASFAEIRDAIFVSADPVASMGGITVTGGRLNAAGTLENVNPHRGSVTLDQQAYPLPDVIEIRVYDADLDVDPLVEDTVTVEISSDTETTPEVVVLTETGPSTSSFVGTIDLLSGTAQPDGTLQAVHGDTVTVVYQDAYDGTGPATVYDTAVIDSQSPVISQIDASPAATRAVIGWTTDEPADSVVRYGAQPDNLNMTVTETSLTTSHSLALAPLTPLSIYYFEITSVDAAGNPTTSDIHSFTTLEVSPILFVDDDEGDSLESHFINALDANEYPYDVWDVFAKGYSPATSDMSDYQVVIWNTGEEYGFETSGLTTNEQTNISGYLDDGGSLFLSGQDILYNGVSWEFRSNYLHVAAYASDEEVYRAAGVSGDPISDGMDLSLSVPTGFEANYADTLLPDSFAAGIFTATETGFYGGTYQYAATRYPANDAGPFKVVFFAFPFEAISTTAADPNNQVSVMANVIDWLGISAPSRPGIAVSPTSGLETTEAGGTANFAVVLNTQPEFDVVIAVTTSDTSEGLVSAGSDPGPSVELTFTPDNWDEPQTVTVTGVDDLEEDDHITFAIVTAPAVSSDPAYHDLDPADVEVTNRHDDRRYPPVLDLDENNSSGATGSDFVTSFDAGGAPVAISDIDAVLADSDSAMLTSLSVVITNVQDVAEELLAADTNGTSISASYDPATGTLQLSGSDTVGNYQQVLRTVTYDNTLPVPNATDRIITFVANDGEQDSNTATTTVSIEGVNKPPVAEANGDYEIRM
jgi:subtilisin family serine protease